MSGESPLIEQPIEGLTIYSHGAATDVDSSPLAIDLVDYAIKAIDKKNARPYRPWDIYELMLARGVDPQDVVLWLGRAAGEWGGDFAALEVSKLVESEEITSLAEGRLPGLTKAGLRFVFLVESDLMADIQDERADRLKTKLGELAVPSMRLRPSILPAEDDPAQEIDESNVVLRYFNIDDRLEYPLILRRVALLAKPAEEPPTSTDPA